MSQISQTSQVSITNFSIWKSNLSSNQPGSVILLHHLHQPPISWSKISFFLGVRGLPIIQICHFWINLIKFATVEHQNPAKLVGSWVILIYSHWFTSPVFLIILPVCSPPKSSNKFHPNPPEATVWSRRIAAKAVRVACTACTEVKSISGGMRPPWRSCPQALSLQWAEGICSLRKWSKERRTEICYKNGMVCMCVNIYIWLYPSYNL